MDNNVVSIGPRNVSRASIPDFTFNKSASLWLARRIANYYAERGQKDVVTRVEEQRDKTTGVVSYVVRSNIKFSCLDLGKIVE